MTEKRYTVGLYTLGCKVSSYETEAVAEAFADAGYEIRSFGEVCDVYVINTCTVTAESDAKSRKYIRRAVRINPQAKVIVMGCYSQRSPREVAEIEGVSAVIGTANKLSVVKLAADLLTGGEKTVSVPSLVGAEFENVDIVREQIRIANGAKLGYSQSDITFNGCAIECRINAEDPETFAPCPGKIAEWHAPGGLGIRVDSEIYSGYSIPPYYDSMIAKLIVHAKTRNACLMRLRRALEEFIIMGVKTTIPLHEDIISQNEFIDGQYNIHWLTEHMNKSKE